jgi:DNA topoisomerase III
MSAPMQLVIAEKPSVARDLARVLGLRASGRAAFEGRDRVITWCVGHLVELEEPAAYDARWKAWRLETLPMIPERFRLRPVSGTRDQLRAVRELLRDRRFTEVVNACDAGREGELIFRYVYELAGSRLPIRRLWISSLTDEAIRQGFAILRAGAEYDPLADAARCRSEADWLVGLNATRAVTVRHRTGQGSPLYSIGRVQTPTLAIVVSRERAIRVFQPRDYWEVKGTFTTKESGRFEATWTREKVTRFGSQAVVDEVLARLRAHALARDAQGPVVERVREKRTKEPPPLLFDLTSLQRTANRRFGLSAARTLELAQGLYEKHKVLTYPRTSSRHLSGDMVAELPRLFRSLAENPEYAPFAQALLESPPRPSRRIFDDAKVEDHHAIVPTGKAAGLASLDRDERRIFDLVARRFLGAFFPDAEFALTELIVRVGAGRQTAASADEVMAGTGPNRPPGEGSAEDETMLEQTPPPPDRFVARGRVRLVAGWQEVAGYGAEEVRGGDHGGGADGRGKKDSDPDSTSAPSLPALTVGQRLDATFASVAKQTRPPPRHTEATLLAAMETAGRAIEDEELRAAMKDTGLGTPATRAATIETLLKRGFLDRQGKQIVPTEMGMALVEALPVPSLASPELTGAWEARLARVARGEEGRPAFMRDIVRYVQEVVQAIRNAPKNRVMAAGAPMPTSPGGAPLEAAPARTGRRRVAGGPKDAFSQRGRNASSSGPDPARSGRTRAGSANGAPRTVGCPRCKDGTLLTGKRGWGCSRWREGCPFVVWFEVAGKRLTEAQLEELVRKGKTRKGKWASSGGALIAGRLVLDLEANRETGAARFEPL